MVAIFLLLIFVVNEGLAYRQLTSITCQNDVAKIICPKNHIINVISANFGRILQDICPDPNNNITANFKYDCMSPNSLGVVTKACNNLNNCTIDVTTDVFMDACSQTTKYLQVDYNCIKVLDCPPNEFFTVYSPVCPKYCPPYTKPLLPCGFQIGCRCTIGYIRDHKTGHCSKPSFCPYYDPAKPHHTTYEEYDDCGPGCPNTCQKNSTVCTEDCVPGYFCSFGFIRDETTNRCLRPEDCPYLD